MIAERPREDCLPSTPSPPTWKRLPGMEFVYVVKRYDLFDLSFPHGFTGEGPGEAARVAEWTARIRAKGFFVERRWAEADSSFKQVIPYNLVVHTPGGAAEPEVLLLERKAAGGESRLHGKLSIGVGGHINPVYTDDTPGPADTDVLDAGCRRELEEELTFDTSYGLHAVGAINDESGDVGSVHFGLVNVAHCATTAVSIRETDVLAGRFVPLSELEQLAADEGGRFETWSALIVPHLRGMLTGLPAAADTPAGDGKTVVRPAPGARQTAG